MDLVFKERILNSWEGKTLIELDWIGKQACHLAILVSISTKLTEKVSLMAEVIDGYY